MLVIIREELERCDIGLYTIIIKPLYHAVLFSECLNKLRHDSLLPCVLQSHPSKQKFGVLLNWTVDDCTPV